MSYVLCLVYSWHDWCTAGITMVVAISFHQHQMQCVPSNYIFTLIATDMYGFICACMYSHFNFLHAIILA